MQTVEASPGTHPHCDVEAEDPPTNECLPRVSAKWCSVVQQLLGSFVDEALLIKGHRIK